MGKIKTVKLGDEKAEEAARKKAEVKREQKKAAKAKKISTGESRESKLENPSSPVNRQPSRSSHGRQYKTAVILVDKSKTYPVSEAVALVKKTSFSKFDGAVEAHINTLEKNLRGIVSLPHGTGKTVRVKIADEKLVTDLEKSGPAAIDFDILVAAPAMMPKLAKVAKILGPRGLMPNPKTNTISDQPEKLAKELSAGQSQYKTETDFPIIHTVIGRVSFDDKKLTENFAALIKAINPQKIRSVYLKATMGPSVKVQI